ncbi:ATP-binding protein [Actinomadura harenae]|uniref:ATP-binding protein n=1 Tax=Actinomadura harenae TaxID=2483351 RepID=A0A3M2LXR6_9ACTN|nr:ATP-binding protein [Actinomadura harenae]RMI42002.1 ATP-binding protein [Actinomadura harenae]
MMEFNTAGPCIPGKHYMLDPLARLPEARRLAERGDYFVVYAPRQSGRTTMLESLARALNATGDYAAVRFSCETAAMAEDRRRSQGLILASVRNAAEDCGLPTDCLPPAKDDAEPSSLLVGDAFTEWAATSSRPLVLLFDEIDCLPWPRLADVLAQLRCGAMSTPTPFPHSVALCGMQNVHDLENTHSDPRMGTPVPYDISVTTLRLGDFTLDEVAELYAQHTEETGQVFEATAVQRVFEVTQGQPWMVNALARDIIEVMCVPASQPITEELVDRAVERLIQNNPAHLAHLMAHLPEPRTRRVIEPLLKGTLKATDDLAQCDDVTYYEAVSFVRALGLAPQEPPLRISNPIYQEAITRTLSRSLQHALLIEPRALLLPDGRLDVGKLLDGFLAFWEDHPETLDKRRHYREAACHLAFIGFLQRVLDGDGLIGGEYGLCMGGLDLALRRPYTDEQGRRAIQRAAFELRVHRSDADYPNPYSLDQLDGYLDSLGLDTGTLIVFDRRKSAPPVAERTTVESVESTAGRKITLVRA